MVKNNYPLKNSLAVKKGAALFKNGQYEKSWEIKEVAKKWLWWYRLMAKFLIATIQVNFVLIPSEGLKLTWIVVIKIFPINLYHHSHFLAAPFISQLFSYWPFLNRAALFLQPGCFWVDITSFCKLYNLSCFSLLQEEESVQADVEIATTFIACIACKYCHMFLLQINVEQYLNIIDTNSIVLHSNTLIKGGGQEMAVMA